MNRSRNTGYGVIVEEGPEDWQILQQKDGWAFIELSGCILLNGSQEGYTVYARVMQESDNAMVCSWRAVSTVGGNWRMTLEIPAGGPYRLETGCKKENESFGALIRGDMRHHFGVGDVFVIAGQSNSAGYGREPVYDPPELGVHLLRNCGRWDLAAHPMNEATDTAHPANMELANPGHCPYLAFAKLMKRSLGYPVGLVAASLGGSPLCEWNPEEKGGLYRSMMETLKSLPGGIKGLLWYQGCTDTTPEWAPTYQKRFEAFLRHFREDLGCSDLLILTVQLNRQHGDERAYPGFLTAPYWAMIREAQRQISRKDPYVVTFPTIGLPLTDTIHNTSHANLVIGEGLARIALSRFYHKGIDYQAPDLAKAVRENDSQIRLFFQNVHGELTAQEVSPQMLAIEVEDSKGIIPLENYQMEGAEIVLKLSKKICGNAVVRGGWQQDIRQVLPKDTLTLLPILGFWDVKINYR